MSQNGIGDRDTKEVRIFMDGAFDLMHYGHMNAFRLGRALGTYLVVGVNSDISITECKGPPLMNDQERLTMVTSCKFVDEVIPDCPYIMDADYVNWVIETYKIDYVVHGDDPCVVNGIDVYEAAKSAGKYRSIPRTHGVSTTDLMGRMLILAQNHRYESQDVGGSAIVEPATNVNDGSERPLISSDLICHRSNFLSTSSIIRLFHDNSHLVRGSICRDNRIVYIDGSWDLFHPGHVAILKAAKKCGDYLIVGVYNDQVVNQLRGMNLPVLNVHERTLSILGCRYADDVLIDAPYVVTRAMLTTLGIDEIVQVEDDQGAQNFRGLVANMSRYQIASEMGRFRIIQVNNEHFRIENILHRLRKNHTAFQSKYDRKQKEEQNYMISVQDQYTGID